MEIKYKLYPYPVLSSYSDDYKDGRFDTQVSVERDGFNLKIIYETELTSKGLLKQIADKNAKYVYHMECAQTGFRKVLVTDKESENFGISNKEVSGKLQICPFVVAVNDIASYNTPEFHDDYSGVFFDIEAGCVMAVGTMVTVDISKDTDDLANTPSIFSIIRNPDAECKEMLVDMSGRKIVIKLPLDTYYKYKNLSIIPQCQSLLNSLAVVPALIYVLGELKRMPISDRMENQDSLWYRTLRKVLQKQFGCDIENPEFDSQNTMELAQKLINSPISEGYSVLTDSFGNDGGDED